MIAKVIKCKETKYGVVVFLLILTKELLLPHTCQPIKGGVGRGHGHAFTRYDFVIDHINFPKDQSN